MSDVNYQTPPVLNGIKAIAEFMEMTTVGDDCLTELAPAER